MSSSNSFGKLFSWTTFGESHGSAMGVVVEGCPAGVPFSQSAIQKALARRRPGQRDKATGKILVSERQEQDVVQILSGVFEEKTLGTPIACLVQNEDQRSQDYTQIKNQARIGHADDTWKNKFGHTDHRGGGRSSARETLTRVIAGSIAQQFLVTQYKSLKVNAFVKSIGSFSLSAADLASVDKSVQSGHFDCDQFAARFPQSVVKIDEILDEAKARGESYGGVVEVWVDGAPAGLGEPVFDKLKSRLALAMMSIGATSGFEIGDGFSLATAKGTEVHKSHDSQVYGGIRGGISTGERMIFRIAFKPTSSILDTAKQGRHDPCIVPRAVPVVEAMTWTVLADFELLRRGNII